MSHAHMFRNRGIRIVLSLCAVILLVAWVYLFRVPHTVRMGDSSFFLHAEGNGEGPYVFYFRYPSHEIVVLSGSGEERFRIKLSSYGYPAGMLVSPSRREVAFMTSKFPEPSREQPKELWVFDADTGKGTRVMDSLLFPIPVIGRSVDTCPMPRCTVVGMHNVSWSEDGTRLLFVAGPSLRLDLFLADLRQGTVTRLTDTQAQEFVPEFTADGKGIAWCEYGKRPDAHLPCFTIRDLSKPPPVPEKTADDYYASLRESYGEDTVFSPNRLFVAYKKDKILFFGRRKEKPVELIRYGADTHWMGTALSVSDTGELLYEAYTDRYPYEHRLLKYGVTGREPEMLRSCTQAVFEYGSRWGPQITASGGSVFYTARSGTEDTLNVYSTVSDTEKKIDQAEILYLSR